MVSIAMLAYNHEKYIAKAIESVLMQNVEFLYQIIIGEDCSTDNTRKIILEYKNKYPDRIHLILHQSNKGMHENARILRENCTGKYIANLEGDDYWVDPYKLQKQVNFLEKNQHYVACAHSVKIVDGNDKLLNIESSYQYTQSYIYKLKDAVKMQLPGQTGSIVFRNITLERNIEKEFYTCRTNPDQKGAVLLTLYGDIYCMEEPMSHYRKVCTSGDSWNAKTYGKNMYAHAYISIMEVAKFANFAGGEKFNNIREATVYLIKAILKFIFHPNRCNYIVLKELYNYRGNQILFDLIRYLLPCLILKKEKIIKFLYAKLQWGKNAQ